MWTRSRRDNEDTVWTTAGLGHQRTIQSLSLIQKKPKGNHCDKCMAIFGIEAAYASGTWSTQTRTSGHDYDKCDVRAKETWQHMKKVWRQPAAVEEDVTDTMK